MLKIIFSLTVVALIVVPAALPAPLPVSAMAQIPEELDLSTNSLTVGVDFGARGGDVTLFSLEVSEASDSGVETADRPEVFETAEYLLQRVLTINTSDMMDRLRNLDLSR
jgi:hypothetical protein